MDRQFLQFLRLGSAEKKQYLVQLPKPDRIRLKKKYRTFKRVRAVSILTALIVIVFVISSSVSRSREREASALEEAERAEQQRIAGEQRIAQQEAERKAYEEKMKTFTATENTKTVSDELPSKSVILVNADTHEIIARKNCEKKMSPASMTKVLTLLVAAENINDWDAETEMTREVQDYCFVNQCSNVGYALGEKMFLRDLPYGTILSSGADAALTMANLCCGDHDAFIKKMNDKLAEMGISKTTHFDNCVGIYGEDHYSTAKDIAIIMCNAMQNEFCREVLLTDTYAIEPTDKHKDGQNLMNIFEKRLAAQELTGVTPLTGKTGYVSQSGYCAVSCAEGADGTLYICVTCDSGGQWQTVYDHVSLYNRYCGK